MGHNTFRFFHRSFKEWLGMLVVCGMLLGCGGGGDTNTQAANQSPTASIVSPSGTYFKEGENIAFNGNGTDKEDGQLIGSALEWTSSVDGLLGTGSTLITSALTAGDHEITLTATDSEGDAHTTDPASIHIEQTRFVKMGFQTTGVTDASNAFDGDHDTAATIMTPDTEFIHFKAYVGDADTFLFKIKLGASTPGSRLAIQGLTTGGTGQLIKEINLDSNKTTTVKVINASQYIDIEGYINLRVRWEGGGDGDFATIFEMWRIEPVYAGLNTQGVINPEAAFDGNMDTISSAKIENPWGAGNRFDYLQFKAHVGPLNTFTFSMLLNSIANDQFLVIDLETSPGNWTLLTTLTLNSTDTKTITVSSAHDYTDINGYISLRARWVGYGSENVEIYEIWRTDPFYIGTKTVLGYLPYTEKAVDGNLDSYAIIYYYWGEADRYDFLHIQAYSADPSISTFSIKTALSNSGYDSELIVEGESKPDVWSEIDRINVGNLGTTTIELLNSRKYINAAGALSLRIRWYADSPQYDAYIYEIWKETE